MIKFFAAFALIAVILAAYPFLHQSSDESATSITGLPWQIDVLPDASTRIFGIHLGSSTLSDAQNVLGDDMEMAIVAASDEAGKLEMYFGHYRVGLLSGKLVLQSDVAASSIKRWRDNAVSSEYMASGLAKKYYLDEADLSSALDGIVNGITFIPAVNLDADVVIARFGEPAERIELDGVIHFLYPQKGLDLALYTNAKEVLQYVPPVDFENLVAPIRVAGVDEGGVPGKGSVD